jgi:hypothetical protein
MVHDQRVLRHVAGITGLDNLRFHLAEMHKDIAPAAGHGTTALHRTTTGVLGSEPVLKPRNGLIQIGYHIANVLNLVKHALSSASNAKFDTEYPKISQFWPFSRLVHIIQGGFLRFLGVIFPAKLPK